MRKIIGEVGVDSGQILVCDPCYIDSEWKREDFSFDRKHKHIDGTILQYRVDFERFDEIIPKYGKSMNQIIEDGEATEMPESSSRYPFSYNACCKATCRDNENENDGQLYYEIGHPGVGVVTSSGYGDGTYPVIADYTKDGRVKSITVVFIDDDEDELTEESREEEDDFLNNDPPDEDHGDRDDRIRESYQ